MTQRTRRTRAEQIQATREALMKAALEVVSRHGYAKASVSRITDAAGVAQGTFYSYFETHQDLLKDLLPSEGVRLLRELGDAAHGVDDYFDLERRTFLAFFEFLKRNPHFLRVLTEAEIAAPSSHAQHMGNIEDRYVNALRRAQSRKEIRPHSEKAFRVIAEILSGARGHIATGINQESKHKKTKQSPKKAVDTYVKFIRIGLGEPDKLQKLTKRVFKRSSAASTDSRTMLLNAAERVLYKKGFEATTVVDIANTAKVAVGTFYSYFPSRQVLLDEILTHVRTNMLDYVREACRGSKSFLEVEHRGFVAFFDYIARNPWYISIESGAAVWANESYLKHFSDLTSRYVASMKYSKKKGELAAYREDELPTLAFILMAARHYLATRYVLRNNRSKKLPDSVLKEYLDFVHRGLANVERRTSPYVSQSREKTEMAL